MIPVESCNVITVMPSQPVEKFWAYFNLYLKALTPTDKAEFMNR